MLRVLALAFFLIHNVNSQATGNPRKSLTINFPSLPDHPSAVLDEVSVLGSLEAQISILEFADLSYPQCRRFDEETFGSLRTEMIDKGYVSFIPIDFVTSAYADAQQAFSLVFCSGETEKFWDTRSLVFRSQKILTLQGLKEDLDALGNRSAKSAGCIIGGDARTALIQRLRAVRNFHILATPTFVIGRMTKKGFVGDKIVSGFLSYPDLDLLVKGRNQPPQGVPHK
jgi:protein-disulfide isomerase